MKPSMRFMFLVTVAILAVSGMAAAQDPGDPPGRIARLQYTEGQVSMQPGGVDDWIDASVNRPLTTADRIWTDRDSRAELSIATAALRLGSETSMTLTNLTDDTAQIELDQGTLNLYVRGLRAGEVVEVDTPNLAFTVFRAGEYRFDVMPDDDRTRVTIRHGAGEADGEGNSVSLTAFQRYVFTGGQSLQYTQQYTPSPRFDGFDDWCNVREQREISSESARYVAAGTVGFEDLDQNGYWETSPMYGAVWYPRVYAGWAPYHDGHWAWVEPWGWTWVDDAPWGFAPFHYGRWVNADGRWGWVPGPVGERPVYAPALVAWVGGVSIGVGGGGVAWVPLGWHDPFIPSYHVSPGYARNVNISNSKVVNVTVINNYYTTNNVNIRNTTISNIHYENAKVNGAVTGVPANAFASGRPVAKIGMVVPASAMARANVMTTASVVPTKDAVLGGHAPAAAPGRLVAPRQVVSKVAPPPRPVTFEQQRPMLEKSRGVPLSTEARANIRAANPAPAPRNVTPAANAAPRNVQTPAANPTAGRPAVTNQPGGTQTFGRSPAANVPVTPQKAQPSTPPSTWGRPANQPAPAAAREAAPVREPAVAHPAQPPVPAATAPRAAQPPTPAPTASRPAQPPVRQTAPAQPPAHATAPAQPPAPAKKTPPPAKDNKDKEKEKEKDR